jgi:hypothetical protein
MPYLQFFDDAQGRISSAKLRTLGPIAAKPKAQPSQRSGLPVFSHFNTSQLQTCFEIIEINGCLQRRLNARLENDLFRGFARSGQTLHMPAWRLSPRQTRGLARGHGPGPQPQLTFDHLDYSRGTGEVVAIRDACRSAEAILAGRINGQRANMKMLAA